jgi:hypothetical protein
VAQEEVTVFINGKEHVSPAAESAGASLTLFGKKIPLVVDAAKLLEMGLNALRSAFQFAKQYVVDSIAAYDAYAASQTKLSAQSKLTGVSMREMSALVDQAREKFGLGTVAAVDISAAVAKFATAAGDSSKSSNLMATALELGASAGMNAKEVAEGLSSALAGNDEWLNRLGLANPSQLWKDYAEANGRAVGTLTDTEQKLAVMTAIMDAGNKVAGVYAERMESGAGAQDKLNIALDEAKIRFGQAIQPARILITQGLVVLVDWMGRFMLAIGRVGNALTVTFVGAFKLAQSVVGGLAVALGKVTGNKDLENWGTKQAATLGTYIAQVKKLEDRYLTTGKAAEESAAQQVTASRTVQTETEKAAAKAEAEARRVERVLNTSLGAPLKTVIGMTEGAIRSLADAAKDQLPPDAAAQFSAHMRTLADRAKEVGERITTVPEPVKDGAKHAKDMAREVETIARGAIDAAVSFGVIDDSAARSLNSAVNIAGALGKMLQSGFTFGGVVGVIGGVASIVSNMMQGDKERRELTRANTEALNKLRTEGVRLSNKASGQQIAGVASAFGGVSAGDLAKLAGMDSNDATRTVGNRLLVDLLAKSGLRLSDLDTVANELGFKIRRDNGQVALSQLPALFAALQENMGSLTRIGQTFGEQWANLRESQRLGGATGAGAIQGLLDFLTGSFGNVRALQGLDLSDPTKARNQLLDLFVGLNNNRFSPADFGNLSGEEFRSVIVELIGLLDGLKDSPSVTNPPTTTTDDVVESNTGVAMSVASVQEVIEAMDRNVVDVLAEHTKLQDRIAVATEGAFVELRTMNGKMDTLIEATLTQAPRLNAQLAATRLIAAANAGRGPEFS